MRSRCRRYSSPLGDSRATIGIIGAVLGLIQVMQHLDKIDEVGRGIAVAFVATIYWVRSANLYIPACVGQNETAEPRGNHTS